MRQAIRPILKYRGGKSNELKYYLKYIPSFDTYFEPFLGGGATFFALNPAKAHIADINERLIDFYRDAVKEFPQVKRELTYLQEQYEDNRKVFIANKKDEPDKRVNDPNEPLYYRIRAMFNNEIPYEYSYATVYYFLNKTAYSGMIRYNRKGQFNVPYGRYAHFNTSLFIIDQFNALKNAEIANESYEKSFSLATDKDFLFLDPPYDTTFSDYGNEEFTGDFKEDDQRKLAENFKNLSAPALMIISSTPLTQDLYHSFIKRKYHKNYSVNIRNRFNSKAEHLIVANYDINKVCEGKANE